MLAFMPVDGESTAAAASKSGAGRAADTARKAATSSPVRKASQAQNANPEAPAQAWSDPDWSQLVTQLGVSGAVRLLASNCTYLRRAKNTVYLGLDPRSDSLLTKQRRDLLAERLSEYFGEQLLVDIAIMAEVAETPAQEETRMADEKLEAARRSLEADPNVQALKNMFGAELKTDTIEIIAGDRE